MFKCHCLCCVIAFGQNTHLQLSLFDKSFWKRFAFSLNFTLCALQKSSSFSHLRQWSCYTPFVTYQVRGLQLPSYHSQTFCVAHSLHFRQPMHNTQQTNAQCFFLNIYITLQHWEFLHISVYNRIIIIIIMNLV